MARFVVSLVSGYRTQASSGTGADAKAGVADVEASVLDADNCFQPVAVFISGLPSKRRRLRDETIADARRAAKILNANERAWEKDHNVESVVRSRLRVGSISHGTVYSYRIYKCRCVPCRDAMRASWKREGARQTAKRREQT